MAFICWGIVKRNNSGKTPKISSKGKKVANFGKKELHWIRSSQINRENEVIWANLIKKDKEKTKIRSFTTIKWLGLVLSVILGIFTGIGRIAVGTHHASDVLWIFGMVYIVNVIFYYLIYQIPKFEKILALEHNFSI